MLKTFAQSTWQDSGLGVKQDFAKAAHLIGRAALGDGPFFTGGYFLQ